jgi:hypothetical protein
MDDIEEIHPLLDELETVEVGLSFGPRDEVDAEKISRLWIIVNEVIGWGRCTEPMRHNSLEFPLHYSPSSPGGEAWFGFVTHIRSETPGYVSL